MELPSDSYRVEVRMYSCDVHRNLIGILEESDFDGDGVIDYVRTSTLRYDRVQAEH